MRFSLQPRALLAVAVCCAILLQLLFIAAPGSPCRWRARLATPVFLGGGSSQGRAAAAPPPPGAAVPAAVPEAEDPPLPPRCPANWTSIWFLHVPKTAGTFLSQLLSEGLHKHGTGAGGNGTWCPREAFRNDSLYSQGSCSEFATDVAELYPHRCNGLGAHHSYAMFAQLLSAEQRASAVTMTLLRHPVERAVSEYYFQRRHHWQAGWDQVFGATNASGYAGLVAYTSSIVMQGDSMTAMLGSPASCPPHAWEGDGGRWAPPLHYAGAALAAAKRRLRELCWFGIQERMEESLQLLRVATGWPRLPSLGPSNTNPHPRQLPGQVYDMLAEMLAADMELYAFALQLFDERVAAAKAANASLV